MAANPLLAKLREGKVLLGVANGFPPPGSLSSWVKSWDFIWVDGQHGQFSYDKRVGRGAHGGVDRRWSRCACRGRRRGSGTCTRTWHRPCSAVPMVDTPEQAHAIVRPIRFPPLGNRSYGGRRPIDLHTRDYHTLTQVGADRAEIETPEALANARAIAAVEGVDVLFFSPDDMKRPGLANQHAYRCQGMLGHGGRGPGGQGHGEISVGAWPAVRRRRPGRRRWAIS